MIVAVLRIEVYIKGYNVHNYQDIPTLITAVNIYISQILHINTNLINKLILANVSISMKASSK